MAGFGTPRDEGARALYVLMSVALAPGCVVASVGAWRWLLPSARPRAVPAVAASTGVSAVMLGAIGI